MTADCIASRYERTRSYAWHRETPGIRTALRCESPLLGRTLTERKTGFFELLLAWGADPFRIDIDTILDTYDAELYERLWCLGIDFTRDHALARALSERSSNRPGYGWARRNKEDPRIARELSIALGRAVDEPRERAVALLMWAGADSHRRVPDLRWWKPGQEEEAEEDQSSPIASALLYGHGHLLPLLKPDPSRDDFDELWSWVCDPFAIDHLAKIQTPKDWSPTLLRNLKRVVSEYGDHATAMQCIEKLTVSHDARLTKMTAEQTKYFRSDILRCHDERNCRFVLRWMSFAETCEPTVYEELMRSAAMRSKASALHVGDARYR